MPLLWLDPQKLSEFLVCVGFVFSILSNLVSLSAPFVLIKEKNNIERRCLRLFIIFSLYHGLSTMCTLKWPRCRRVQIAGCLSHEYLCHMVRRDKPVVKFDRVKTTFILVLIPLAETIHWCRRGRKWNTKRKGLLSSLSKCLILEPENSSLNWDLNSITSIGGRCLLRKWMY